MTTKEDLDSIDWVHVSEELVRYVHYRSSCRPLPPGYTVEDIVNEAVARLYGQKRDWDKGRKPNIIPHLKLIVKSMLSDKGLYGLGAVKVISNSEQLNEEVEWQGDNDQSPFMDEAWDALRIELVDDREAIDVIDAIKDFGLKASREIAELLEYDVKQVYEARRRINRALARIESSSRRELSGETLS